MSEIGYYRIKIKPTEVGSQNVDLYINGALSATATIITKDFCEGKILKYIDSSGRYRIFSFNKFWQRSNKPQKIGSVDSYFASITTGQTDSKNIGYKNTQSISLAADTITNDELDLLEELLVSPRIYYYIGLTGDTNQDWVLVDVSGDGITRRRKNNFGKVNLTITLPKYYSITLL